jgi:hypothetical protein
VSIFLIDFGPIRNQDESISSGGTKKGARGVITPSWRARLDRVGLADALAEAGTGGDASTETLITG